MTKNNIRNIILIAIVIGGAVAAIHYYSKKQVSETPISTLSYTCDAGKSLTATYYVGESTESGSVHLTLSDGRILTLPQVVSADGARYANPDESFVFWSKGSGATIVEDGWQNSYTGCTTEAPNPILGCYEMKTDKDVYSLLIASVQDGQFTGKLEFDNFEKDSSSGTYSGTYADGILLGDYSFQSEGMQSVMQVAFQKSGDSFVRGYGDVDATGTHFSDVNTITYDSSMKLSVFKRSPDGCLGSES